VIPFALARESHVRLEILDIHGRLVRVLLDEKLKGGFHSREWDGGNHQGTPVPSGLYFYRLAVDNGSTLVRKALLVR
jgi:flagellar hook assembly protein FlgD